MGQGPHPARTTRVGSDGAPNPFDPSKNRPYASARTAAAKRSPRSAWPVN